jgi:hypothetical protein
MLNIDLSTSQKLQIGFVVLVLGTAGYQLYNGMRAAPDSNVASWVEPRRVATDPSKPISAKNPADPAKQGTATIFNCFDGRLEIAEYPPDSNLGIQIRFEPDKRRTTFQHYKDPLATISSTRDGYKRALLMAAYSASLNRPLGVLTAAALTKDQLTAEKAARDLMLNEIVMFDQQARAGSLAPTLHKQLVEALDAFRKTPGDALKDKTKGASARKVIAAALAYMAAVQDKRMGAINKYVAAVDKVMQNDQKPKITAAAQNLAKRFQNGANIAPVVSTATLAKS